MLFVEPALFHRHLGLPEGAAPDPATASLADAARDWYRENGDPWAQVSIREIHCIDGNRVVLDGDAVLTSAVLADGFRAVDARQAAIVGVSAGAAVDREIDARFQSDHPLEAMFLNAYAVAVAEHLRASQGRRLLRRSAKSGMTVLPHYSPGYDGWELDDQATLFAALEEHGPLSLLPSGGLQPARSALAVFGITAKEIPASELDGFWFHQRRGESGGNGAAPRNQYSFPEKTLAKWSHERLTIEERPDGKLIARFRFDGTTCSSLGMPLTFDYSIELSAERAEGRRIVDSSCRPGEGYRGYRSMCGYLADPDRMTAAFAEQPLLGRRLDDALGQPARSARPAASVWKRTATTNGASSYRRSITGWRDKGVTKSRR